MHPASTFLASGFGLAILRDGKLLLYKRVKAPEAGHWNIVGGKVDHLEPSELAAKREAEEETGLSIGQIEFVRTSEQIIDPDRQHWISLLYRTEDFTGEPALTGPDKLSDFGWFKLDDLPEPLSAFTRAMLPDLL